MNLDSKKIINPEPDDVVQSAIKSINDGILDNLENMLIFTLSFKFLLKKYFSIDVTPGKINISPELREGWNRLCKDLMDENLSNKGDDALMVGHSIPYEELMQYLKTNFNRTYEKINSKNLEKSKSEIELYYNYNKSLIISNQTIEQYLNSYGKILEGINIIELMNDSDRFLPLVSRYIYDLVLHLILPREFIYSLIYFNNPGSLLKLIDQIEINSQNTNLEDIRVINIKCQSVNKNEKEWLDIFIDLVKFRFSEYDANVDINNWVKSRIETNNDKDYLSNGNNLSEIKEDKYGYFYDNNTHFDANCYDAVFAFMPYNESSYSSKKEAYENIASDLEKIIKYDLMDGGCASVLVTEEFLFSSNKKCKDLRERILKELSIECIVSLPPGAIMGYSKHSESFYASVPLEGSAPKAKVKCSLIILKKTAPRDNVCFFEIKNDGFSQDNNRIPIEQNDIPFLLKDWDKRDISNRFIKISKEEITENGYNLSTYLWNHEYVKLKQQLKNYKDTWNLKEISDIKQGSALKPDNITTKDVNGIPIIHAANFENGKINFDSIKEYVVDEKSKGLNVINERVVLLVIKGKGALIAEFDPFKAKYKSIVVPRYIVVLRPNGKIVNYDYFLYSIESDFVQNQIMFAKSGSYIPSINLSALRKIKIPRVPLSEQLERVRVGEQEKRERYLQENKLLNYLRGFKIHNTREEMMADFCDYIKNELDTNVYIHFKYKESLEDLTPFSLDDIKKGEFYKIQNDSTASVLVYIDKQPYCIIYIEGEDAANKISSETFLEFATVASFVIQSFLRVKDAALEEQTSDVAHEFKNAYLNIQTDLLTLGRVITSTSMGEMLTEKEEKIDAIRASGVKVIESDYQLGVVYKRIMREFGRVTDSISQMEEDRNLQADIKFENLDIIDIINKLIIEKKVKLIAPFPSCMIYGVERTLRIALRNFIENALKYSPDTECIIEIEDKGVIRLRIKNKTTLDIPREIVDKLGRERVAGTDKRISRGAFLSTKYISNNKGSVKFAYSADKKEFEVVIELKKGVVT